MTEQPNLCTSFTCGTCKKHFPSSRRLTLHQSKHIYCSNFIDSLHHNPFHIPQYTKNRVSNKKQKIKKNSKDIKDKNDQTFLSDNIHDDHINACISSGNPIPPDKFYYSNEVIHEIKLLKILNDIGAPLYSYQIIMEWAHEAYLSNYKFDTQRKTYHQTIKYLEDDSNF